MGPFPHDAPPAAISDENPMGTDGFEFVEFCHPDPQILDRLFRMMGFSLVAKHRSKNVMLYRQGDINFIVNAQPGSFAERFASQHGPSAPAMAFRVVDAKHAYERALSLGAKPVRRRRPVPTSSKSPPSRASAACRSTSSIAMARKARSTMWTSNGWAKPDPKPEGVGLYYLDHLTHNVVSGTADGMGRVLREALQLPPDPLFRHRG